MKRTPTTILEAIGDENLFASHFPHAATWSAWRAFLGALFGHPMSAEDLALYQRHTGRQAAPAKAFDEAWLVCGRRGGKSRILALIAVYLACFRDYRPFLAAGEVGTVRLMAVDRDQARAIFRFIGGFLRETPALKRLIARETADSFELTNRTIIEVGTASFRSARGYSFIAVLADEIAFWRSDESTNPDTEILRALRPGLLTIPGAKLLCASSPYARKGALWEVYDRYFGKDDAPVLIWRGTSVEMNPTIPQAEIDREYEKDPASAAAEFGAEFRTDVEGFVSVEAVRACIEPNVRERLPDRQYRYYGFVDPSGGSNDAMTLAISHKAGATVVLDAVREIKPPFSPEAVVEEFAKLLRSYRCTLVYGDRYGGEWPREVFRRHRINYEAADRPKSDLYRDLLPLLNAGGVDLLDNDRMVTQLVSLERHTARGGRDSIDHPRGTHDDVANAVAGAVTVAARQPAGWRRRDREATRAMGSGPPRMAGVHDRGTEWMYRR
jgi:hypothetical protein